MSRLEDNSLFTSNIEANRKNTNTSVINNKNKNVYINTKLSKKSIINPRRYIKNNILVNKNTEYKNWIGKKNIYNSIDNIQENDNLGIDSLIKTKDSIFLVNKTSRFINNSKKIGNNILQKVQKKRIEKLQRTITKEKYLSKFILNKSNSSLKTVAVTSNLFIPFYVVILALLLLITVIMTLSFSFGIGASAIGISSYNIMEYISSLDATMYDNFNIKISSNLSDYTVICSTKNFQNEEELRTFINDIYNEFNTVEEVCSKENVCKQILVNSEMDVIVFVLNNLDNFYTVSEKSRADIVLRNYEIFRK